MLFRWAWALALAAVLLLVVYNLWIFSTEHQGVVSCRACLTWCSFFIWSAPRSANGCAKRC